MFLKQILLNCGIKAVSELSCQLDKSHSHRIISFFTFYFRQQVQHLSAVKSPLMPQLTKYLTKLIKDQLEP